MRSFGLVCLAAALLTACGSGEESQRSDRQATGAQETAASSASHARKEDMEKAEADQFRRGQLAMPEEEPPTSEQAAAADKVLAWSNKVQDILARGTLADKVATCTEFYRETWRLPHRPRGSYVRDFAPTPGIIRGQSARMIDDFLAAMDKASDEMLSAYGKLEKYAQDVTIQDDGKLGRDLAARIMVAHAQYLAARKSFMAIVEQKTQEAEDTLLRGHPLKRQIRLSRDMFVHFREIGDLLATGTPAPELLEAYHKRLQELIEEAGRPPFPANPGYERLYRQFLHKARDYAAVLQRGISEGFHSVQKRELLRALDDCRKCYNAFAAAINNNI